MMYGRCLLYASFLMLGLLKLLYAKPDMCYVTLDDEEPIDYCQEPDQPHIACNNSNKWDRYCGKRAKIIPITSHIRKYIVRQHNVYRNIVAKGTLKELPIAARMLKMKWNENLADVAEYAVKLCKIEPLKKSFSTLLASKPGFNAVYNKHSWKTTEDVNAILRSQIKAFYEEYRYVSLPSLQTEKPVSGQEIRHFLQVMIGNNDKVGCAIASFRKGMFQYQLMICLYGCYKKLEQVTYKFGKIPAEGCVCGSDRIFKNLCATEETLGDCGLIEDSADNSSSTSEIITTTPKTTSTKKTTSRIPGRPGGMGSVIEWVFGCSSNINICGGCASICGR